MVASTMFSELWASRVLIWLWKKKRFPWGVVAWMLTSGFHQYLSITWGGLCYFLWPELCPDWRSLGPGMDLWTLQPVQCCSETWGSKEGLHVGSETTLILLLDCDHCLQTEKSDSLVLLARAPSWVLSQSQTLICSWHFLSSSWIKDHSLGEKPAEASVTHPKIKVKALCQVLIRQKPSVPGLERQIMEKNKKQKTNFTTFG